MLPLALTVVGLFIVMHLFAHPEDRVRFAISLAALAGLFALASMLHPIAARAVAFAAALAIVGAATRVYDARRPNRSRTRR